MTERPILFSAPMVRALLAGTKTQTRRIVKPQPDWEHPEPCCSTTSEGWQGPIDRSTWAESADPEMDFRRSPYGGPGDVLWVREAWSPPWSWRNEKPRDIIPCAPIWYWADGDPAEGDWTRPKPSIHMPRWVSRISLRITDVRVERIQDISRKDAEAEGLIKLPATGRYVIERGQQYAGLASFDPRDVYADLWESINGAGSWDANPWVWAVSFEVMS